MMTLLKKPAMIVLLIQTITFLTQIHTPYFKGLNRCRYSIFQHANIGTYNNIITVLANHAPVENLIAVVADVGHPDCPTCHAPRSTVVWDL